MAKCGRCYMEKRKDEHGFPVEAVMVIEDRSFGKGRPMIRMNCCAEHGKKYMENDRLLAEAGWRGGEARIVWEANR